MSDVILRKSGRAGRITLNRPQALNALNDSMLASIETALDSWRDDDAVALVIIDAAGDKAFCAGGDIAEMYRTAKSGDYDYGRRFWANEYRLNAKISEYPKPYVAFMHGFTLGGGVGVSCHGSHRVVCETTRIGMPECGIGLTPDVGGSWLLSRAPGRLGEYLGTTGARMNAMDAIHAGFADHFVPSEDWGALIATLETGGACGVIADAAQDTGLSNLAEMRAEIDFLFASHRLDDLRAALAQSQTPFARSATERLARVSPLAAGTTLELLKQVRRVDDLREALSLEYRATWRSAEDGDFVEGIRAAIIDRDQKPVWRFQDFGDITPAVALRMLAPIPGKIDFNGDAK